MYAMSAIRTAATTRATTGSPRTAEKIVSADTALNATIVNVGVSLVRNAVHV
jgi:hypothetical protein